MKSRHFFTTVLALLFTGTVLAQKASQQQDSQQQEAVTFEEIYDEPSKVNKLFVGFQPFYGEVFATNVNAGYGLEASYFHNNKFDFKAHLRKTYSSSFFDFSRDLAKHNSTPGVKFTPEIFNYYEFGATYHFRDFESEGKTTVVLYKGNYKGNLWAAQVPQKIEVPCKVRKIYGARLGAIIWNSTTELNRALKKQGLTNASLKNSAGVGLPLTYQDINGDTHDFNLFGNIYSAGFYTGASISWFRNVAVSVDKFDDSVDDGMLTLFFDIQYAPYLKLNPITYTDPSGTKSDYSTSAIKLSPIGFRAGVDGKFNRKLSWSYGGEIGYRPSIQGRTFYYMFKIAFPLFGSNLENKVESFQRK